MPGIKPLGPRDSWLGTRRIWSPCRVDGTEAKGLLFRFRKARAPWLRQDKLLAVVCCHKLFFFRDEKLPKKPLRPADAILSFKPAENGVSICQEWSEWPESQALIEGLVGGELEEFEPRQPIADFVLKCFHAAPLPGWTPIHRGHLGLSFVRNVIYNQTGQEICAELTSSKLYLYNKPLPEAEALRDRDVMKSWDQHDLEPARLCAYLDAFDIVQCRLICRYAALWRYQYFLNQESLPF
ncbi:MAG: hypothetical protein WA003_14755 [Desulfuromonadaceae bacterium]